MYKIYDNFNNFIKCKNLCEVERTLLDYYNKNLIKIVNIEGFEDVDVIYYNYNKDLYGNPLFMIIFYNTKTRKVITKKSVQSYNIDETIKNILNK